MQQYNCLLYLTHNNFICKQDKFGFIFSLKIVDIDECAADVDPCNIPSEVCGNTAGSFTCNCSDGYELIAETCTGTFNNSITYQSS